MLSRPWPRPELVLPPFHAGESASGRDEAVVVEEVSEAARLTPELAELVTAASSAP